MELNPWLCRRNKDDVSIQVFRIFISAAFWSEQSAFWRLYFFRTSGLPANSVAAVGKRWSWLSCSKGHKVLGVWNAYSRLRIWNLQISVLFIRLSSANHVVKTWLCLSEDACPERLEDRWLMLLTLATQQYTLKAASWQLKYKEALKRQPQLYVTFCDNEREYL